MRRVVMITGMQAAGKNSYRGWQRPGMTVTEAVEAMQRDLEHTPRRGLRLDTSDMTAEQAVDAILADEMAASRYRRGGVG